MNKREFERKMKKAKLLIEINESKCSYNFKLPSCCALKAVFNPNNDLSYTEFYDLQLCESYKSLFSDYVLYAWLENDLLDGQEYEDINNLRIDMLSLFEEITLMNKNYLEW